MRIRTHHSCCSHNAVSSTKQGAHFFFASTLLSSIHLCLLFVCLVGTMATEKETLGRVTALQLDQDTIAAIIDGVGAKLQKAPTHKGHEPSTSVACLSRGEGKKTRITRKLYRSLEIFHCKKIFVGR